MRARSHSATPRILSRACLAATTTAVAMLALPGQPSHAATTKHRECLPLGGLLVRDTIRRRDGDHDEVTEYLGHHVYRVTKCDLKGRLTSSMTVEGVNDPDGQVRPRTRDDHQQQADSLDRLRRPPRSPLGAGVAPGSCPGRQVDRASDARGRQAGSGLRPHQRDGRLRRPTTGLARPQHDRRAGRIRGRRRRRVPGRFAHRHGRDLERPPLRVALEQQGLREQLQDPRRPRERGRGLEHDPHQLRPQ